MHDKSLSEPNAPRALRACLLLTDIGMLTYWGLSLLMLFGVAVIPAEYLFKDYDDPIVVAWNWSFLPLDLALSITGLWGVHAHRRGDPRWVPLVLCSATLTFCAGLMAVAFWTLRRDFDPTWWGPNLFLVIWPCVFLPRLVRATARPAPPPVQH